MRIRAALAACFLIFAGTMAYAQQNAQEELLQTTRSWVKSISQGDRTGVNAIMDAGFLAVTPAGDLVTKERIVPDDPSKPVQKLPPFDLDNPMVRLYGDAAVVMTRLTTPGEAQVLNATFVFSKRDTAWKLVALHVSPK